MYHLSFQTQLLLTTLKCFRLYCICVFCFLQKCHPVIHELVCMHHEEFNKSNRHSLEAYALTAMASLRRWLLVWYSGYFYLFLSFADSRYHGDLEDHAGNVLFGLPGSL